MLLFYINLIKIGLPVGATIEVIIFQGLTDDLGVLVCSVRS